MVKLGIGLVTLGLVFSAFAAEGPSAAPGAAADRAAASERLASFFLRTNAMTRVIPASEVREGLDSGARKYFVVDVRSAEEYAKGHVPGAASIPLDVLFRPAGLSKLPTDGKSIVLVCNTGHMESMAFGGLVALGYEPYVMRFGMLGWNAETKVKAGSSTQQADTVHGLGGPVEKQEGRAQ